VSTSRQVSSPRELLVPYIEWLRKRCLGMAGEVASTGETKISFGQRTLSLDAWELERLRESLGSGAAPAEHCVLLTEIVALLLKCMADGERFAAASGGSVDQFYRLQAELMLDSNLGNSLIGRTQRAVDSLVQEGMTQEARQLSGTLHKLRRSLIEVNRNAGTKAELPPTGDSVPTITISDRAVERLADPSDAAETYRDRELETVAAAKVGSARTRVLAVVFALTAAIWVVAVKLPAFFGSRLPQLRISELQAPAVQLSLHSRWPTLYVEARGEVWDSLRGEERRHMVTGLVERASEKGFTSMLMRTTDGRTLAQWWRGGDVRWVDPADADRAVPAGANVADAIETGPSAS